MVLKKLIMAQSMSSLVLLHSFLPNVMFAFFFWG